MSDLISRQDALNALNWTWAGETAIQAIKDLPSAERKKGRWMHDRDDELHAGYCSCCEWMANIMETDVAGMPYCPNCGARME